MRASERIAMSVVAQHVMGSSCAFYDWFDDLHKDWSGCMRESEIDKL